MLLKSKPDPRTHTKSREMGAFLRVTSCDFVDRFLLSLPLNIFKGIAALPLECCFQSGPEFFYRQVTCRKNNDPIRFGLPRRFNRA